MRGRLTVLASRRRGVFRCCMMNAYRPFTPTNTAPSVQRLRLLGMKRTRSVLWTWSIVPNTAALLLRLLGESVSSAVEQISA